MDPQALDASTSAVVYHLCTSENWANRNWAEKGLHNENEAGTGVRGKKNKETARMVHVPHLCLTWHLVRYQQDAPQHNYLIMAMESPGCIHAMRN